MVIVSPDAIAAMKRQLDELIGPVDGDDPKVVKRVRILDAAEQLFTAQGYRKTSMGQVAREAGVAKGTVYLYFETKIDLLVSAMSREKRALWDDFQEMFDESIPARERLRKVCLTALLAATRMPMVMRLVQGEELTAIYADLPPALLSAGEDNRDTLLLPLLREVAPNHPWTDSELRDRVRVLGGLSLFANAIANEQVLGIAPQRYAEILTDLIVDGLASKGNSQ